MRNRMTIPAIDGRVWLRIEVLFDDCTCDMGMCPHCDGRGFVTIANSAGIVRAIAYCPDCNGCGYCVICGGNGVTNIERSIVKRSITPGHRRKQFNRNDWAMRRRRYIRKGLGFAVDACLPVRIAYGK